jgi:hypothetical protein
MKPILLCALAFLVGCAHHDYNRGASPRQSSFESGSRIDPGLPYRTGPGLPSTDREIPARSGPGGLGTPDR